MTNLKEAINKIREVGMTSTRITPITNSNKVKIEININGSWVTLLSGITHSMAEDAIRQANGRLILG